jgi:hypothetical protein
MSLTSPPLGSECCIHSPEWITKAAAALHYLETHGGNLKDALAAMFVLASTKPSMEPDVDEGGYWKHELKALQEVFAQTGLSESGGKSLQERSPAAQVDQINEDLADPDFYQEYLSQFDQRMDTIQPHEEQKEFPEIASSFASMHHVFLANRPMNGWRGMTAEAEQEIRATRKRWEDLEQHFFNAMNLLHWRYATAIGRRLKESRKLT